MRFNIAVAIKDEIEEKIGIYLNSKYEISNGHSIPEKSDIAFGPKAKKLAHVIVLYADLRGSRDLLSKHSALIAARAHKAFLYACSKCIRKHGGHLRSFNGDSVLAFFEGEDAAKRAVKAAMQTKCAVSTILNPKLEAKNFAKIDFGIGIGQGEVLVVKSGVPGNELHQDLIWIGWPTYHAFEYGDKANSPNNIWISNNIFNAIKEDENMRYSNGKAMWSYSDESFSFGSVRVYKTTYYWNL